MSQTDGNCNFSSPVFMKLSRELAPMSLHVGGAEADEVYYDMSEQAADSVPDPFKVVSACRLELSV